MHSIKYCKVFWESCACKYLDFTTPLECFIERFYLALHFVLFLTFLFPRFIFLVGFSSLLYVSAGLFSQDFMSPYLHSVTLGSFKMPFSFTTTLRLSVALSPFLLHKRSQDKKREKKLKALSADLRRRSICRRRARLWQERDEEGKV